MDDRLKFIAADFTRMDPAGSTRLRILKGIDYKDYFVLYLLLVEQLGMRIVYGGEKTAWTTYFNYREQPFAVSFMKGGLLLFGTSSGRPCLTQLMTIFRSSRDILQEIYKDQITKRIRHGGLYWVW